jgi:DNA-binding XRE family transcriptional regulator
VSKKQPPTYPAPVSQEIITEVMRREGESISSMADRLQMNRQTLTDIINGKRKPRRWLGLALAAIFHRFGSL